MLRRSKYLGIVLALLAASCTAGQDEGIEARAVRQYSIEDFLDNTSYVGASFSADNAHVLVSSDETGVYNAFAVPIHDGEQRQLTHSTTDAIFVEAYFPDDERFIYSSDQGGNELDHLYVWEADGQAVDITPGENLKAEFLKWSRDDRSFFITTNERDPRFFDLYEVSAEDYTRELIFQDDEGYDVADITPDRRYLALEKTITRTNSDIYLYDRETQQMTNLTPHEGEISNVPQSFSPDGASLYFLTDEGSEFRYLVRYDLESGEHRVVERPDWDVVFSYFSKHGTYLVVGVNADARTEVAVYETATMTPIQLPALPPGDISGVRFSDDEDLMSFYLSNSKKPRDLFVFDLRRGEVRQLTQSLNEDIDSQDLVQGEVVRFDSYDGMEIPGILYRPHQASAENRVPALVWVHGGPGGQSRIGYNALLQYLVNHGYAVYAINNRGSRGYGKTFFRADDRAHGDADLGDVVTSKEMLVETGYIDPNRIGILGGSYGGYMVLAALAFRPQAFEVGVDLFGISNWLRTLESIPPWWESFRQALYREMGDPEADRDYLIEISPLFHAENIVKPLIVLQGANDPRVLKVESDEIVEAVRANGVPVEYIVFEDEGHGFSKKENRLEGYRAILRFLDEHLKGAGTREERVAA